MRRGGRWWVGAGIATAAVALVAASPIGSTVAVIGCGSSDSRAFEELPDAEPPSGQFDGDLGDCGLPCRVPVCSSGTTTSISGTVLDPGAKNPIYNAIVYVPGKPVEPFAEGVQCDHCGALASGAPFVSALTNERGEFRLEGVPAGADVPLVVQLGKWRRQLVLPNVTPCVDNPIDDKELTRLPRKQSEGDIPLIAVTTGCDPMECLLRRFGVDDSEFTTPSKHGRVHLYKAVQGEGAIGSPYAETLWDHLDQLERYDIVLMSCECDPNPTNKSPAARQAMSDYAAVGGRVFGNHYHSYWFREGTPEFKSSADWIEPHTGTSNSPTFDLNTSFPKGQAFADWLTNVDASVAPGKIAMSAARSVGDINPAVSQRWISETEDGGAIMSKYLTFNAPVGKPAEQQCGRVVFTDLHLGTGSGGKFFPEGCATTELTPAEKALEFLFFDLASCVQDDKVKPEPPR